MFKKFKPIIDLLPGDIAEVGVYQGKSARMLAETFFDRTILLFDTFSGMPASDPSIDGHSKGDFGNTSLERVKENLKAYKNIHYFKGIFPDTAAYLMYKKFAFVNIDVDLYLSTINVLLWFWPRLVKQGILFVQDDYGAVTCRGVKKAVDEFVSDYHLELRKNGSEAWIIK